MVHTLEKRKLHNAMQFYTTPKVYLDCRLPYKANQLKSWISFDDRIFPKFCDYPYTYHKIVSRLLTKYHTVPVMKSM